MIQVEGHLNPQRPEGLVFPRLTSGNHKKPEKSANSRRRTDRIKDVLRSLGLKVDHKSDDHFHPWQVLRRTATSRLFVRARRRAPIDWNLAPHRS